MNVERLLDGTENPGAASPLVVVNARARQAAGARWEVLRRGLAEAWRPRFVYTEDATHAAALVREALARGCPALGAAGGDGTVNVVLNALDGRDVPLAVIPLGTANDLAGALPPSPLGLPAGADVWKRIDVLEVNGRRFCTTGGVGIPAEVVERAERVRAARGSGRMLGALGASLYSLVAAEYAAFGRSRPARREISWLSPGATRRCERVVEGVGLFVSNQPSVGGSLLVCPASRHDDGVFEISLLHARTPVELLSLLALMRAGRRSPQVEVLSATAATIGGDAPGWFFGDGELLSHDRRFEIAIRPGAIRVARLLPPGAAAARTPATAPW